MIEIIKIVVPIIASIIGAVWYLRGYFSQLESRFGQLENRLDIISRQISSLGTAIRGVLDFEETLITALSVTSALKPEDVVKLSSQIIGNQKDLIAQATLPTKNPITVEESQKLECYIDKLERQERLTRPEIQDFQKLVQKLKRERPDMEGTWILAGIAGLLLGMYLSSKE